MVKEKRKKKKECIIWEHYINEINSLLEIFDVMVMNGLLGTSLLSLSQSLTNPTIKSRG